MVAFHFPPLAGSSGIQRTLRFVQHLPSFGWEPLVLTAHERGYERTSADLMRDVPGDLVVRRAWALDTARHLSVGGRYIGALARPDRWMTWRFDAVQQGMRMIRQYELKALWSTYPIATAHVIGAELARRSGLPWIADFRDPMAQDGYPADPLTWADYRRIEEQALMQSAAGVFTTPGAAAEYRRRYPAAAHKVTVIENGYDEESFGGISSPQATAALNPGATTLLHSGIVYPSERDPTQLFAAVAQLHRDGQVSPRTLRLRFRAAVHDELLQQLAQAAGVAEYLECCPPLGYRDALAEMLRADALLVLQATNCNQQIPAKLYEYLRARRPIVALTDPVGDTAGVLQRAGLDTIAPLDDVAAIARLLSSLVRGSLADRIADDATLRQASRAGRCAQLAALLDTVHATSRAARPPAAPVG